MTTHELEAIMKDGDGFVIGGIVFEKKDGKLSFDKELWLAEAHLRNVTEDDLKNTNTFAVRKTA